MSSSTSSSEPIEPSGPPRIRPFAIAFVTAAAILLGSTEWLLRTHVVPQDTLTRHVEFFENNRSRQVAFGDSHVARGFLPDRPVANLAYPSEGIEHLRWKAHRYLQRVPGPDTVLLQADPHLFAAYRLRTDTSNYAWLFDDRHENWPYLFSDHYRPQLTRLWRSYVVNGGRLTSNVVFTGQGGLLSPGNVSKWSRHELDEWVRDRVALHRPIDNLERSDAAQAYAGIVKDLLDAGARVCLVSFPVAPDYLAAVESLGPADRADWDAALTFYRSLAADPRVSYFDDRARYADLSLFRDPDHLNREGARRYSVTLQQRCFGGSPNRNPDAVVSNGPAADQPAARAGAAMKFG